MAQEAFQRADSLCTKPEAISLITCMLIYLAVKIKSHQQHAATEAGCLCVNDLHINFENLSRYYPTWLKSFFYREFFTNHATLEFNVTYDTSSKKSRLEAFIYSPAKAD